MPDWQVTDFGTSVGQNPAMQRVAAETGEVAFYHLEHDQQPDGLREFDSNPITGQTDDLVKSTGFSVKGMKHRDYDRDEDRDKD